MMLFALAALSLFCAAIPAWLFVRNMALFERAPQAAGALAGESLPRVSVLVPARDEAHTIEACLRCVLANRGVDLEVMVLDDRSADGTAEIVNRLAQEDRRVRSVSGQAPPAHWCGKQYACWQLAQQASRELLLFLDADVRLAPDAIARSVAMFEAKRPALLSGFPRQVAKSPLERLLLPLIQFILLGFLSLRAMRHSPHPSLAAGCGQFFLTRRGEYHAAGGHAAIRDSLHDGIKLPRQYRKAGLRTDLFDASDLASCRMYHGASEVWAGLSKNATEGVATLRLLPPVSLLLLFGQVLPILLLASLLAEALVTAPASAGLLHRAALLLSLGATLLSYLPPAIACRRFKQSSSGALLHPLGILLFLIIQWQSLIRALLGHPVHWKGRPYPA